MLQVMVHAAQIVHCRLESIHDVLGVGAKGMLGQEAEDSSLW